MGFFSDMNNNEFVDDELGTVKPIVPSKTVKSDKEKEEPVVKKRTKVTEVVQSDDEDSYKPDFTDEELNEILNHYPEEGSQVEDEPNPPKDFKVFSDEEYDEDEYDDEAEQDDDDEEEDDDDEEMFVPLPKKTQPQKEEKEPVIVKEEVKAEPVKTSTASQKVPLKKLITTTGTVISADAVVDGNLTLNSSVTVLGKITGFLSAGDVVLEAQGEVLGGIEGNTVSIEGKVEGDIKGANVTIGNCKIKGNLYADNSMTISEKATVVGGVTAGSGDVTIYGKVKGDVESAGTVILKTGAVLKGNITAVEVLIDKGTTFQGSIFKAGEIDDSMFE